MTAGTGEKRTEHNGAKNGGGAWCKREDAKRVSRRLRRAQGKRLIRREVNELPPLAP